MIMIIIIIFVASFSGWEKLLPLPPLTELGWVTPTLCNAQHFTSEFY